MLSLITTCNACVSGNADIMPASAEEIEKAIAAAQAKILQAATQVFDSCISAFVALRLGGLCGVAMWLQI